MNRGDAILAYPDQRPALDRVANRVTPLGLVVNSMSPLLAVKVVRQLRWRSTLTARARRQISHV